MFKMIGQIMDPYERKARVAPGLITIMPIIVPLVAVYGPKHLILTSLLSILGGSGAIYALASVARGLGKRLEERLIKRWGGLPTTIILRHRDDYLDRYTKARYHDAIRAKFMLPVPSSDEEALAPEDADQVYMAAAKRLRELTRGDSKLLLKENIAYGFHRNMTAMKPFGVMFCVIGVVYGLVIANVLKFSVPFFVMSNLFKPGLAAGLTILVACAMLACWGFYFTTSAIRRVGNVYAERLYERLPGKSRVKK